jgi:hypothetical protein
MQTTFGVSLCAVLLLTASACSSKSTDDENKGGNGGLVPSGGTGNGAGGSSSQQGGASSTPLGGSSPGRSGASSGGASTGGVGTGGTSTAAQECIDTPITCVDAATITGCNPDTLMNETVDCKELIDSQGPGLKSEGCTTDAGRSVCSYDFEDAACRDGAAAFAVCYEAATGKSVDPLDFYFDCFTDFMYNLADMGQPEQLVGAKTIIPCFTGFISGNTIDCEAAEAACFPVDGTTGAGGAGP